MDVRCSRYLIKMMLASQKVEQLILTSYRQKIEKCKEIIENSNDNNNNNMNWNTICLTLTDIFNEHCALQRSLGNQYGRLLSNLIERKETIINAFEQENQKKEKAMMQLIAKTKEFENREPEFVPDGTATTLAKDSKNETEEKIEPMTCQIRLGQVTASPNETNKGTEIDSHSSNLLKYPPVNLNQTYISNNNINSARNDKNNVKNSNINNNNNNKSSSTYDYGNDKNNSTGNVGNTLNSIVNWRSDKSISNTSVIGDMEIYTNDTSNDTSDVSILSDLNCNNECLKIGKAKMKKSRLLSKSKRFSTQMNDSNNKSLICHECGKTFKLKQNLIAHEKIHQ